MCVVLRYISCFHLHIGLFWRSGQALFACAVLVVSAPAFAISDSHAIQLKSLPSITAEHLRIHADSKTVLSKSRVQFSPAGMRLLQLHASNKLEIVQNFVTDQMWLIDRQRSIKHELELTAMKGPGPIVKEAGRVAGEPQPGLLSAEPCIDLDPLEIGVSSWRGQAVSVWHCLDQSGQVYTRQFFSLTWNVVIREQGTDGLVDELRLIKNANFSVNHFIPEKKYRQTDLRELLLGMREINRYAGD